MERKDETTPKHLTNSLQRKTKNTHHLTSDVRQKLYLDEKSGTTALI